MSTSTSAGIGNLPCFTTFSYFLVTYSSYIIIYTELTSGICILYLLSLLITIMHFNYLSHYCTSVLISSLTGQLYGCQDGHAVITSDNWIMSCPPTDEVVSQSPLVYNELPVIPPTAELGKINNIVL